MNTVDIILLVCFIPGVIRGLMKGFMVQICSLIGFVASVWCAWKFSAIVAGYLTPHLNLAPALVHTLSFALILFVVAILFALLGKLLAKLMKVVLMGWVDRLLGLILGIFVTAAILGVLVVIFDNLDAQWHLVKGDLLKDSVVYQGIKQAALTVFPYLKQLITSSNG